MSLWFNFYKKTVFFVFIFLMFAPFNYLISKNLPADVEGSIPSDNEIFLNRIKDIQKQLKDLENEVAESETGLLYLKTKITDAKDQAKLIIQSNADLDPEYILVESIYYVDDKKVATLNHETSGKIVYSDLILPGKHQIAVEKLYKRIGSSLSNEPTLHLKNRTSFITVLANTTTIDVTVIQKKNKSKRWQNGLAIQFDVKTIPTEIAKEAVLSFDEVMKLKEVKQASQAQLLVILKNSSHSSLKLIDQKVYLDKKEAQLIAPSLIMDMGQIILDAPIVAGAHEIEAALKYQVSGKLAQLWKTTVFEVKYSKRFSAENGHQTTIYLKGIEDDAKVVLPKGQTTSVIEVAAVKNESLHG